mmetsp:Transcript_44819/g.124222  ORF Transcript_44819/g.124222 Transcript_44819/m.124222 type:complete len:200 (+) Transcript_44819:102-701(+)
MRRFCSYLTATLASRAADKVSVNANSLFRKALPLFLGEVCFNATLESESRPAPAFISNQTSLPRLATESSLAHALGSLLQKGLSRAALMGVEGSVLDSGQDSSVSDESASSSCSTDMSSIHDASSASCLLSNASPSTRSQDRSTHKSRMGCGTLGRGKAHIESEPKASPLATFGCAQADRQDEAVPISDWTGILPSCSS